LLEEEGRWVVDTPRTVVDTSVLLPPGGLAALLRRSRPGSCREGGRGKAFSGTTTARRSRAAQAARKLHSQVSTKRARALRSCGPAVRAVLRAVSTFQPGTSNSTDCSIRELEASIALSRVLVVAVSESISIRSM